MLIVASHVNSEPILICVIYYFVVNNLENTQLAHAMRNNIMVEVNKFAKLLRISLNHTGKDNVDSHRYFNMYGYRVFQDTIVIILAIRFCRPLHADFSRRPPVKKIRGRRNF